MNNLRHDVVGCFLWLKTINKWPKTYAKKDTTSRPSLARFSYTIHTYVATTYSYNTHIQIELTGKRQVLRACHQWRHPKRRLSEMECRRVSTRQVVKSSSHLVIRGFIRSSIIRSSRSNKTNGLSCFLFFLSFLRDKNVWNDIWQARIYKQEPVTGQPPGLNSEQESHITFWQMIVFISNGKCLDPDELWSLHQKGFATATAATSTAATSPTAASESIGLRVWV